MRKSVPGKQQEVQRIVDALSSAIAQHRLKPGMRLVEAQIVEALNANRNHVQAALQRMVLQHIVTVEPHRGAMVARPEAREAVEVFIARRAIESAVIDSITPAKMAAHQQELAQQQQAEKDAIAHNQRLEIIHQLSHFHLMLAKISGNQVLNEILTNLLVRSSLIIALYQRNENHFCQCLEHGEIVAALQNGDIDRAQRAMKQHLDILEQQLDLDESTADPLSLREALAAGY